MDPIKITSKTHVMISGGAGFVGSHLSRRLLRAGARVTILTRHVHRPAATQLAQEGAVVIPCDLSSSERVPSPDHLRTADILYHLAADVSVGSPALTAANVEGTRRVLDLVSDLKIPYVVYASSIEAQGLGSVDGIPLREEHPCHPLSDYGVSKARAEELVAQWACASGGQVLTLRIGNVYGPGSAWLLQPFIMALLGLFPLSHVWASLKHRLFQPLYIDDLIDGIVSAAGHRLTGLYNLTGEEPVTVDGYLCTLAALLQMPERLSQIPAASAAPARGIPADIAYLLMGTPERCHRAYDNGKLRSAIGTYARWSLARGLASTLQWFHRSDDWPALLRMAQAHTGESLCMSH